MTPEVRLTMIGCSDIICNPTYSQVTWSDYILTSLLNIQQHLDMQYISTKYILASLLCTLYISVSTQYVLVYLPSMY